MVHGFVNQGMLNDRKNYEQIMQPIITKNAHIINCSYEIINFKRNKKLVVINQLSHIDS